MTNIIRYTSLKAFKCAEHEKNTFTVYVLTQCDIDAGVCGTAGGVYVSYHTGDLHPGGYPMAVDQATCELLAELKANMHKPATGTAPIVVDDATQVISVTAATTAASGVVELATEAEVLAGGASVADNVVTVGALYNTLKDLIDNKHPPVVSTAGVLVTVSNSPTGQTLDVRLASATETGVVELATDAEAAAGLATNLALTPANVKPLFDARHMPAIGTAPITVTNTPTNQVVGVNNATTTALGVVQYASAADLTAQPSPTDRAVSVADMAGYFTAATPAQMNAEPMTASLPTVVTPNSLSNILNVSYGRQVMRRITAANPLPTWSGISIGEGAGTGSTGTSASNIVIGNNAAPNTVFFGNNNIVLGTNAASAATMNNSTAIGALAASNSVNSSNVTALGNGAASDTDNIAVGTAVGYYAGAGAKTATSAVFVGREAGRYATSVSNTVAVGHQAGYVYSGVNATNVGLYAGYGGSGIHNTNIATLAGAASGSYNVNVGVGAGVGVAGAQYSIAIGTYAGIGVLGAPLAADFVAGSGIITVPGGHGLPVGARTYVSAPAANGFNPVLYYNMVEATSTTVLQVLAPVGAPTVTGSGTISLPTSIGRTNYISIGRDAPSATNEIYIGGGGYTAFRTNAPMYAPAFNVVSDERLKSNVKLLDAEKVVARLALVAPVSYTWADKLFGTLEVSEEVSESDLAAIDAAQSAVAVAKAAVEHAEGGPALADARKQLAAAEKALREAHNVKPKKVERRVGALAPETWRGKKNVGLIAQKLREVMPEVVDGDPDKENLTVNTAALAAVGVTALAQLVVKLMERVAALEAK